MQPCTDQMQAIPPIASYELSASDLGHFNAILQLVCEISGAPAAAVNLVDAHKQKTLVSINCPVGAECTREDSICAIAIDQNMPLIINDMRQDHRVMGNAFVVGEGGIQFYAGFPIYRLTGGTIGALCTFDWHPRALSAQQQTRIADLAKLAGSMLELHFLNAEKARLARFMAAQAKVLQTAMHGASLNALVDELLIAAEKFHGGIRLSVKATDENGKGLRWISGPSLSNSFIDFCRANEITDELSPCNVTASTRHRVDVPNVNTCDLSDRYREALLSEGICSVISVPLVDNGGALLGVLTLYCAEVSGDQVAEDALIGLTQHFLSTLIERTQTARILAQSL